MSYSLTYDDIQLVPKYSNIPTRTQIKLHTLVSRRYGLLNPIVNSPMDTVCGLEMNIKCLNSVELVVSIDLIQ